MSGSQATSAILGGFAAKQGIQLVQEVPASVASAVGLVGLSAWWMLSSRGQHVRKFVVGGVKGRLSYMMKKRIAADGAAGLGREDEDEFVMVEDGGTDERDGNKKSGSESAASEEWDHVLSDDEGARYIKSDDEFEDARGVDEETLEEKVFSAILSRDSQTAINMLEDGEVHVEATDAYDNTLLMLAAQSGAAPVVAYLLDRGINVDAQNWRGQTALHFALAFEYHALGDLLLARGARRDIRNDYGLLPEEGLAGRALVEPYSGEVTPTSAVPPLSPGGLRLPLPISAAAPRSPRTPRGRLTPREEAGKLSKSWEVIQQFRALNRRAVGPVSGAPGKKAGGARKGGKGRGARAGEEEGDEDKSVAAAGKRLIMGAAAVKEELESRSGYVRQINAERDKFGPMILDLARQIAGFKASKIEHIQSFLAEVERRLAKLTDERMVLKGERFAALWPERRLDAMREAAALDKELRALLQSMDPEGPVWVPKSNVKEELMQVVEKFDVVRPQVDARTRSKDEVQRRLEAEKVPFDWSLLDKIVLVSVGLAKYAMGMMLSAFQDLSTQVGPAAVTRMEAVLEKTLRFAFRIHQFAGGFDQETTELFSRLHNILTPPEPEAASA